MIIIEISQECDAGYFQIMSDDEIVGYIRQVNEQQEIRNAEQKQAKSQKMM